MTLSKRLPGAVLDSSAIFAVLEGERAAPAFLDAFGRCEELLISAGTLAELSILMMSRAGNPGAQALADFLDGLGVKTVPVGHGQVTREFRAGFSAFGKGLGNRAKLNYGDLFAYALARELGLPLLFQGLDFGYSDVNNAMAELGYPINRKGEPHFKSG